MKNNIQLHKVSNLLGTDKQQKDLKFINLFIEGNDNRFYLDSYLIEASKSKYAKKATLKITDFFNTIFNMFDEGKVEEVREILNNFSEKNATRLGNTDFASNAQGRGSNEATLHEIFYKVYEVRRISREVMKKPEDVTLFVPNFFEDKMSDLLTSIIIDVLVEFTSDQIKSSKCEKLNFEKTTDYLWNEETHEWNVFEYEALLDYKGFQLLLVPKDFVTGKYKYNVSSYLTSFLMKKERDLRREKDPTYDINLYELYKEMKGVYPKDRKQFALEYTLKHISFLDNYRNDRVHSSKGTSLISGRLTDQEIEDIVNKAYPYLIKRIS